MKVTPTDYIKELVDRLEKLARENERLKIENEQLRKATSENPEK